MDIVVEKGDWNVFCALNAARSGGFLQSWEWGEVLTGVGGSVLRVRGLEARALVVLKGLPFGFSYSYVPRGPVGVSAEVEGDLCVLLEDLRKDDLFLRFDLARGNRVGDRLVDSLNLQPDWTLISYLDKSDDELLDGMHKKTRYNIRLAGRKGVEIVAVRGSGEVVNLGLADDSSSSLDGDIINKEVLFDEFVRLSGVMAQRQGIRVHGREYFKMILEKFNGVGDAPRAFLVGAVHDGDVLAANIMVDWNGQRVYLHGASGDVKRNFMAPYLLHWELMRDARERDLTEYDWWGIAPEGDEEHKLAGVTRFKMGFGGERVGLPGTGDLVLRGRLYSLYAFVRRWR